MIDRALFAFVALFIIWLSVVSCYSDRDPNLPPVDPDYPRAARDAGRG